MRVLLTGATGFIGSRLLPGLDDTVVLSRDPKGARRGLGDGVEVFGWDPMAGPPPAEAFERVDGVVHLAGEPVNGRWTSQKKRRILESRVIGTRNLVSRLLDLSDRPRVLVSASAVGYYGDRGDEVLGEESPPGSGFLAEVCRAWEAATGPAAEAGIRVAQLRTGLVLAAHGGGLAKMLPVFRLGLGGRLGSGRQYVSWITLDDVVGATAHVLQTDTIQGPVNLVAPHPVTNREFTRALGHVLGRPTVLPAPAPALRIVLGQMADELLLASARAVPRRLLQSGYTFRDAELDAALRRALGVAGDSSGSARDTAG